MKHSHFITHLPLIQQQVWWVGLESSTGRVNEGPPKNIILPYIYNFTRYCTDKVEKVLIFPLRRITDWPHVFCSCQLSEG